MSDEERNLLRQQQIDEMFYGGDTRYRKVNEQNDHAWRRRADDHLGNFKTILEKHTKEEMERYDEIIGDLKIAKVDVIGLKKDVADLKTDVAGIKGDIKYLTNKVDDSDAVSANNHAETQDKIHHLANSVEAWMSGNGEFIEAIKRAFPKDKETGKPDYDGHRTAHLAWIEDSADSKQLKKFIRNVILGAAATAIVSFITIASWAAFLKGPTP